RQSRQQRRRSGCDAAGRGEILLAGSEPVRTPQQFPLLAQLCRGLRRRGRARRCPTRPVARQPARNLDRDFLRTRRPPPASRAPTQRCTPPFLFQAARVRSMTPKRPIPFAFALEALAEADPSTRPMFGCTAVYVGERIVMILRERNSSPEDNGVWLATTTQHHASLRREFPSLRSIRGGRAVGTAGQVGAERPRNSVGRSAPGDRSGAGPAGLGSQGPSSAERKVGRG